MNATTNIYSTWTNEQLSNAILFAYRTNTADQRTVAMQKEMLRRRMAEFSITVNY